MSTKPKAARFFLHRVERPAPVELVAADAMPFATSDDGFGDQDFRPALSQGTAPGDPAADEAAIAAIAAEGLTGRQLRRARLMAQKHGFAFSSDLHAVLLMRRAGIDPFAQDPAEAVSSGSGGPAHPAGVPGAASPAAVEPGRSLTRLPGDRANLPAKARPITLPSTETRADQFQFSEIQRIQQDITRRRRRQVLLLFTRLFVFVLLPTLLAGYYFYRIATPVYATYSEFVIQSAEPQSKSPGGLGGLLSGTGFASSQDANAVQGYLQSREAMLRLEDDVGFREHFQNPAIDPLQRLEPNATLEETYDIYSRFVKISHDPSEGLIRMEVMAMDPQTAAAWANQLIKYAEEQVDQLTKRMRDNQMEDAKTGYDEAQAQLSEAQQRLITLQEKFQVLNSTAEINLITQQIAALDGQLLQERLSLAQMEANTNPNAARMDPVKQRISTLESQIEDLRNQMTEAAPGSSSLAEVQGQLLIAQADVETRQTILAQALQSMETARVEAGRQVRYLLVSVSPTAPDEPAYPRAFENTLVTLLILLGIYLLISMTTAILREQVSA